ncbi:hypothetical protein BI380_09240 [Delftia tsuruhatensis]|uniref:Uncharacterized protein n=1 Tax=Delftia tsuruhatensis TaxID=180282 RepID=A0ABM6E334_9BURK|nr:hypothetical protein BI380_09240 [Delftia tsuruhatensis]
MACSANGLLVVFGIRAAFLQWDLMVPLDRKGHDALAVTGPAQRLTLEQFFAQLLELAACHALGGCGLLCPGLFGMLWTPARAIADQHATARMRARTRGS